MPKNFISDLRTVSLQRQNGPLTAIMIALNIPDPLTADAFIAEVAEIFKVQRRNSPAETRGLLFTIIGELPAAEFLQLWRKRVAEDSVLAGYMSQMQVIDVIRGS